MLPCFETVIIVIVFTCRIISLRDAGIERSYSNGLDSQHLPLDLANVNA